MSKRTGVLGLVAMLLLTGAAAAAGANQPRSPIPSDADQADAKNAIENTYRDFFAKTAPADELDLANTLLGLAARTYNDPAKCYMFLIEARELALKAHNLDTADAACQELARQFDITLAAARLQMLQQADGLHQGHDDSLALGYMVLRFVDDALTQDDFSSADQLLQLADAAAQNAGDAGLSAALAARKARLTLQQSAHAAVAAKQAVLADHPDDPDANLVVGKYDCFIRGDWADGLPMLAKSSDPQLKQIAQADLANPDKPSAQADVGEQWYDFGKLQNLKTDQAQLRAYYWYQKAAAAGAGLTAKLAEARIEQLQPIIGQSGGMQQLWFAVDKALRDKSYVDAPVCGGGAAHADVEEVPPNGAILIGLRVGRDTYAGNPTVGFYQAIYLTRDGETVGQPVGTLRGDAIILKARPGYAVGSIVARGGAGMDALTLTFMKITGDRLDPNTAYRSDTIGGTGGSETDYDGRGVPIIGIHGKQDEKWPGFGVVFMSDPNNAPGR